MKRTVVEATAASEEEILEFVGPMRDTVNSPRGPSATYGWLTDHPPTHLHLFALHTKILHAIIHIQLYSQEFPCFLFNLSTRYLLYTSISMTDQYQGWATQQEDIL